MEDEHIIEAQRSSRDIAAADFESDEWNAARPVRLTRYWSGREAPSSRQAEARIIWTPDALCVRFVCAQAEPLIKSDTPQVEQKTLGLWDRDVCEIYVATDAQNPQRYLEFEAAPTGEWLDLSIEHKDGERLTGWRFNSGMSAAAHIGEGVITIALRVPWPAFGRAPQPDERWRVNLFRCVGAGPERGYLAWQPTRAPEPNFHVPSAFGWLRFKE
ncbi:MAG: hypothetical protein QOF02_1484 [Blastocatellia bacterium]|jgi:alpha-galactosidase|nr:hypothetical protein [Blastocatellia bacterium]